MLLVTCPNTTPRHVSLLHQAPYTTDCKKAEDIEEVITINFRAIRQHKISSDLGIFALGLVEVIVRLLASNNNRDEHASVPGVVPAFPLLGHGNRHLVHRGLFFYIVFLVGLFTFLLFLSS